MLLKDGKAITVAGSFLRQPTAPRPPLFWAMTVCYPVLRGHAAMYAAGMNCETRPCCKELSARLSERFMNHHPFSRNKYTHQHRESWKNLHDETKQTVFKKVVAKDVFYFFSGFLQTCFCFFFFRRGKRSLKRWRPTQRCDARGSLNQNGPTRAVLSMGG